jgi:hypothetical protein
VAPRPSLLALPHREGLAVLTLIVLGLACLPFLLLTWLVERITEENRPVPGCGCGGGCRGHHTPRPRG